MKMKILLFVVSSITVLCAGQDDESQSPPPSYKTPAWSRYQPKQSPNKSRLPQSKQYYSNYNNEGKRQLPEFCQKAEQCLADNSLFVGSSCFNSYNQYDVCAVYVKNSQCSKGQCVCQEGFVQLNEIACLPFVNLNEECSISSQCHESNSHCNNEKKCVCNPGFVLKGDKRHLYCIPETKPLDPCQNDEECTTENSVCMNTVCQCSQGFVKVHHKCLPARHLGEVCEVNNECVDDKSQCVNSVCECQPSTVSVTNPRNKRSKCLPVKHLGEKCLDDVQCQHKREDRSCQIGYCQCQQELLNVANQLCLPGNVKIGEACFVSAQCQAPLGFNGRIGCYLESPNTESLCLVEGKAFKGGVPYRYNQPSFTPQPYKPKKQLSKSCDEEEDDDDVDQDNKSQDKLQQKNKFQKFKYQGSKSQEKNEDESSNKMTSGNRSPVKVKNSNQDQSEDDYSDDNTYPSQGKSSKGLLTTTQPPRNEEEYDDRDEYEDNDNSGQYYTKMPFKTTTPENEDEITPENQATTTSYSSYPYLMNSKTTPKRPGWVPKPKYGTYHQ